MAHVRLKSPFGVVLRFGGACTGSIWRLNCGVVALGTRTATARAPRQAPRGPLTPSVPGGGRSLDEQVHHTSPRLFSATRAPAFLGFLLPQSKPPKGYDHLSHRKDLVCLSLSIIGSRLWLAGLGFGRYAPGWYGGRGVPPWRDGHPRDPWNGVRERGADAAQVAQEGDSSLASARTGGGAAASV